MDGYDALGYGTHLFLDGFRADAERLADERRLASALRAMFAALEEGGTDPIMVRQHGDRGVSGAIVAAESHLCLHSFPALDKLSLEAFSTRAMPVQSITETFLEGFGVGRFECRVHGRGRLLPRRRQALEGALRGDRIYARLRLRDLLSA